MVKNPWGKVEWTGPWSDGSKEWTDQALRDLNYKFGNDGIFWMPYSDFLDRFVQVWRTRLFSPEWSVSQQWASIKVPWSGGYNRTLFEFKITLLTPAVIALSQLDSRYYGGLAGQYSHTLAFRLHKYGNKDHIIQGFSSGDRSAVTEVDLKPGRYVIVMKVAAYRDSMQPTIADVLKSNWLLRRDKLIRTGSAYESAHAKSETKASASGRAEMYREARYMGDGLTEKEKEGAQVPAQDQPWRTSVVVGLKVFCQNTSAAIKVHNLESESVRANRRWRWVNGD